MEYDFPRSSGITDLTGLLKTRLVPETYTERVISGEFGVTPGPYNVSFKASEQYSLFYTLRYFSNRV
jgi:hypothetical protein